MTYRYEKMREDNTIQYCPLNDYDGSITGTGHCIIGLKAWFDENPEQRKKLGWIKHIYYETTDEILADVPEYDARFHYLAKTGVKIDDYTVQDKYNIIEKTEEMMELEEMLEVMNLYVPAGVQIVDSQGGAII